MCLGLNSIYLYNGKVCCSFTIVCHNSSLFSSPKVAIQAMFYDMWLNGGIVVDYLDSIYLL